MGFITDVHNQEIERLRAAARLEEMRAATMLAERQRDLATAELVRARGAADTVELDRIRLANKDASEGRLFWLKLAMIVGGAAALCTLFASAASAP